jgi:hypothetical protein
VINRQSYAFQISGSDPFQPPRSGFLFRQFKPALDLDQKCARLQVMSAPKGSANQAAIKFKRVLAYNIRQKLEADKMSITNFARRIKTGRIAVRRLLDPTNTAVTLKTMTKASHALGLEITIGVSPKPLQELEPIIDEYLAAEDPAAAARLEDELVAGYYGQKKTLVLPVKATLGRMPRNHAKYPAFQTTRGAVSSSGPKGQGTQHH